MSKNLIYVCKNKLGGIDTILPIFMEIKTLYPETKFILVPFSNKHLNAIRENYNIWEAIQLMNPRVYVIKTGNKFFTLIRLIIFIAKLFFRDNIILREGPTLPLHSIVMKILKKFSRTKEIKTYLSVPSPDFAKNLHISSSLLRERIGVYPRTDYFRGNYDYFLSALSSSQLKEAFNLEAPKSKMITTGYTRKLPKWQKFMDKAGRENKIINNDSYFLYILTYTGQRFRNMKEPDVIELVEESLDVLKKYNNKIKTVFKPKSTTDIDEILKFLDRLNYSNYAIDYSHPMILSSKAKFIFANVYSCTMFDAYYQGKPVVEYCQYDPELFERIGRRSYGGRYCDFCIYRDKQKLDEVLDKLINDEVKVNRDPNFIESSFPDTPQEFYNFWHKLLA